MCVCIGGGGGGGGGGGRVLGMVLRVFQVFRLNPSCTKITQGILG